MGHHVPITISLCPTARLPGSQCHLGHPAGLCGCTRAAFPNAKFGCSISHPHSAVIAYVITITHAYYHAFAYPITLTDSHPGQPTITHHADTNQHAPVVNSYANAHCSCSRRHTDAHGHCSSTNPHADATAARPPLAHAGRDAGHRPLLAGPPLRP